ncbi:DUF3127 domain-containing protein [Ruegeria atlantica]|uniref:DUF3127 domain-containing protein n=1 Tax=Ruegeria atlantica TaxID=81569 RepID=A0A0P1EAM2_9RHOB|nr:DUF3127 domain-containing protein [Ruegeria atlantica]CUH46411.1 hypothetical protein RUA4292_00577 [Ruegeria atlantica]
MEISGKIIEILPEKSGASANGTWRKQEYVLETDGQYPKKICFMAWGDKIDQFEIRKDESLTVSIDLESREYNGRWYTDVKAWKISRAGADNQQDASYPAFESAPSGAASHLDDDIPF